MTNFRKIPVSVSSKILNILKRYPSAIGRNTGINIG